MKAFETFEKVRRFTSPVDMETKVKVVIQTGGNNPKVKYMVSGYEAMLNMWVWTHLTPKGVALVFNEKTDRLLGYIALDIHSCPVKYKEPKILYFKDMYERVED
jgi:hypothetical protein